jgi:hypothetical protein
MPPRGDRQRVKDCRSSPDSSESWVSFAIAFGTNWTAPAALIRIRVVRQDTVQVDVRAMQERATRYEPNVAEGRFMIHAVHQERPWIVIVEPDVDAKLLVVVTPYEVFQ